MIRRFLHTLVLAAVLFTGTSSMAFCHCGSPSSAGLQSQSDTNMLRLQIDTADYGDSITVHILMDNQSEITAVQFYVNVPNQFTLDASTLTKSSRCPVGDALMSSSVGTHTWCVLLLSMQNALISGHTGEIVSFRLTHDIPLTSSDRTVTLSHIVLSNVNGTNMSTQDTVRSDMVVVLPSTTDTIQADICQGMVYTSHGFQADSTGTYQQHFTNSIGGDSTIVLLLNVHETYLHSIDTTITDQNLPFLWGAETISQPGHYLHSYTSAWGCDSTETLQLNVLYSTSDSIFVQACDSFLWNGYLYAASGIYTDTIENHVGADSVIFLHLTLYPSLHDTIEATSCDSYTWNESEYSLTGSYVSYGSSIHGCDSNVTLLLTIHHSTASIDYQSSCDSLTWMDGVTYWASTEEPTQTLVNALGCDSIVTLHLTLYNSAESYDTVILPASDMPYTIQGYTFSDFGEYELLLTTLHGCDSLVHLVIMQSIPEGTSPIPTGSTVVLYPNPTSGFIHVGGHDACQPQEIEIYDMRGTLVYHNPRATSDIDIRELAYGTYLVRMTLADRQTYWSRIMKQSPSSTSR